MVQFLLTPTGPLVSGSVSLRPAKVGGFCELLIEWGVAKVDAQGCDGPVIPAPRH